MAAAKSNTGKRRKIQGWYLFSTRNHSIYIHVFVLRSISVIFVIIRDLTVQLQPLLYSLRLSMLKKNAAFCNDLCVAIFRGLRLRFVSTSNI